MRDGAQRARARQRWTDGAARRRGREHREEGWLAMGLMRVAASASLRSPLVRSAWARPLSAAAAAAPRFFDYPTITANMHVRDAIPSVEAAFGALAEGKVDVPFPMHIGVAETPTAGWGDSMAFAVSAAAGSPPAC